MVQGVCKGGEKGGLCKEGGQGVCRGATANLTAQQHRGVGVQVCARFVQGCGEGRVQGVARVATDLTAQRRRVQGDCKELRRGWRGACAGGEKGVRILFWVSIG